MSFWHPWIWVFKKRFCELIVCIDIQLLLMYCYYSIYETKRQILYLVVEKNKSLDTTYYFLKTFDISFQANSAFFSRIVVRIHKSNYIYRIELLNNLLQHKRIHKCALMSSFLTDHWISVICPPFQYRQGYKIQQSKHAHEQHILIKTVATIKNFP